MCPSGLARCDIQIDAPNKSKFKMRRVTLERSYLKGNAPSRSRLGLVALRLSRLGFGALGEGLHVTDVFQRSRGPSQMFGILSLVPRDFRRGQRHVRGFVLAQLALAIVSMSNVGKIVKSSDTHIFVLRHGDYPMLLTPVERLSFEAPEGEDGIQAAEREGIRERELDGGWAGDVRDHVEVAGRVGLVEIGGGWQDSISQGEQRGGRLDGAGRAEGMAVHGLGGAHPEPIRVLAKDLADGRGFGGIVGYRRGAVRVDVADVVWLSPSVGNSGAHGSGSAIRRRLGDMESVGGHAKAGDFAEYRGAARAGGIQRLQHQHRRSFAQDEAAAVP